MQTALESSVKHTTKGALDVMGTRNNLSLVRNAFAILIMLKLL